MQNYNEWIGNDAYDSQGEKIGEITDIFYDDQTGRPEWLSITGLSGAKHTLVPIHGSKMRHGGDDDDTLQLAFDKAMIKGAPRMDPGGHLSAKEEAKLWEYYGYDYQADPKLKTAGYGTAYTKSRADKDLPFSRYDREQERWSDERRAEEHMDTVKVQTEATVPVEATVRLRRYQTQNQRTETRQVEVPVTETEEHVEVEDVDTRQVSR